MKTTKIYYRIYTVKNLTVRGVTQSMFYLFTEDLFVSENKAWDYITNFESDATEEMEFTIMPFIKYIRK